MINQYFNLLVHSVWHNPNCLRVWDYPNPHVIYQNIVSFPNPTPRPGGTIHASCRCDPA